MIIAVTLPTIAVDSSAQRTPIIHYTLFIIHYSKLSFHLLAHTIHSSAQ